MHGTYLGCVAAAFLSFSLLATEGKKRHTVRRCIQFSTVFLKSHARKKSIQISMMYLLSIAAKHYCGNYVVSYVSPSLDGFRAGSGWDF